jgi:hypothetical protein
MSTFLDDAELDQLMRSCDPVDTDAVARMSNTVVVAALHHAIVRSAPARSTRRRGFWPAALAGAAAAAVAVPLALVVVHPSSDSSAYGAELVRFAESSPQLLPDSSGWRVTRADEQDVRTGEMTFASGARSMDLFWVGDPAGKETDKVDMARVGSAVIDGRPAWVGTYGGNDFEAIWSSDDQAFDVRGTFPSVADFLAVATSLHRVSVDTWLDAMPASVVDPTSRTATVEQMLADIPQPRGFDITPVEDRPGVSDRYQLGAQVVSAVSCAWIQQWTHGDAAARQQAAEAMATSRHWPVLMQMQSEGAYPDVIWRIADIMNGKSKLPAGQILEQWSRPAIGC